MSFKRRCTNLIPFWFIWNVLGVNGHCDMQEKMTTCPDYDNKEPTTGIGLTVNVDSYIWCLHVCLHSGLTRSVFYNPATNVCQCADKPPLSLGLQDQSGVVCTEEYGFTETWASSVIDVSSEYNAAGGDARFLATQLLGATDVYPHYGDTAGTWCADYVNDDQWIEVGIAEAMFLDHLYIYETYHAGGIETISVRDTQDTWHVLWTTPGIQVITSSRIFEPDFQSSAYKINGVRLDIVMSVAVTQTGSSTAWVQFDAIRFVGRK